MNCKAAKVIAATLTFSGMQSCPYSETQTLKPLFYSERALDSPGRTSEGQDEAVPGSVDFLTSKAVQFSPHGCIMQLQNVLPLSITHFCGLLSRADNISHYYGQENPLRGRRVSRSR
jgi:hypothetical protein